MRQAGQLLLIFLQIGQMRARKVKSFLRDPWPLVINVNEYKDHSLKPDDLTLRKSLKSPGPTLLSVSGSNNDHDVT